jgi:hypothetical protein
VASHPPSLAGRDIETVGSRHDDCVDNPRVGAVVASTDGRVAVEIDDLREQLS